MDWLDGGEPLWRALETKGPDQAWLRQVGAWATRMERHIASGMDLEHAALATIADSFDAVQTRVLLPTATRILAGTWRHGAVLDALLQKGTFD